MNLPKEHPDLADFSNYYKEHCSLSGKRVQELFSKYGVFDYIREFFDRGTVSYKFISEQETQSFPLNGQK